MHTLDIPIDTHHTAGAVRHSLREIVREWGLMHDRPAVPELTLAQGHALIEIESRGLIPISVLSQALNLDHSSASRLVARLQAKGFLDLITRPDDKRMKELSLTSRGKDILKRLHAESDKRVESGLALLQLEQQQCVRDGLKLYAYALKKARNQSGTKIRRIEKKDNRSVGAIIRSVMSEFGADGPGFAINDAEVDTMAQSYAVKKHAYFILERNGKIVGGGGIAPLKGDDASVGELRKMYLLPEARGCGLGEKLLTFCLSEAVKVRFKTCYLETTSKMIQAQSLYKKLGFVPLKNPRGNTGHNACDAWYQKSL